MLNSAPLIQNSDTWTPRPVRDKDAIIDGRDAGERGEVATAQDWSFANADGQREILLECPGKDHALDASFLPSSGTTGNPSKPFE
jgi:hypothetical protein